MAPVFILVAVIALALILSAASQASADTSTDGTDVQPEIDSMMGDLNSKASDLAHAIAQAEGYYQPNSLPLRANNPGDLEIGDVGYGTIAGKTIFGSPSDGWDALRKQVLAMLNGSSHIYSPQMSLQQVAQLYTGNDNAASWASNVARFLGLDPGNSLSDFLGI